MVNGLTLRILGEDSTTVATMAKKQLATVGRRAEIIDARLAERIGCAASRTLVCELLTRNGVVVLVTTDTVSPPERGAAVHTVDMDISPALAVEQALAYATRAGLAEGHAVSLGSDTENTRPMNRLGYVK